MNNPLRYQISSYDCGPTALLNAISYLFPREEIPAEIIRNIMLYSLDCYGPGGTPGKAGTSRMAMRFLANWLDGFGKATPLPLSATYLSGQAVRLSQESLINDALYRGGAVVVRLFYDVEHYVLLTGIQGDRVLMFDPWYLPGNDQQMLDTKVEVTLSHEAAYNRIVPQELFNREENQLYALGPVAMREAVLLFNARTKKTAADTIEYFI